MQEFKRIGDAAFDFCKKILEAQIRREWLKRPKRLGKTIASICEKVISGLQARFVDF